MNMPLLFYWRFVKADTFGSVVLIFLLASLVKAGLLGLPTPRLCMLVLPFPAFRQDQDRLKKIVAFTIFD